MIFTPPAVTGEAIRAARAAIANHPDHIAAEYELDDGAIQLILEAGMAELADTPPVQLGDVLTGADEEPDRRVMFQDEDGDTWWFDNSRGMWKVRAGDPERGFAVTYAEWPSIEYRLRAVYVP